MVNYKNLWAKKTKDGEAALPLYIHLTDTAHVMGYLWRDYFSDGVKDIINSEIKVLDSEDRESQAEHFVVFLAAVHDIGKAAPEFQAKMCSGKTYDKSKAVVHHSRLSQAILEKAGFNKGIASIVGAHHGKPPVNSEMNKIEGYPECTGLGTDEWDTAHSELLTLALDLADTTLSALKPMELSKHSQLLISAMLILADWIASDENLFPLEPENTNFSDRADKALENLNLVKCQSFDADLTDLYYTRFGLTEPQLRPVQEKAFEIANGLDKTDIGLFIIEAPMGEGKTEAALAVAEVFCKNSHRQGLYFALPTQATSDAMYNRVITWLKTLGLP
jgi:CRISPR-associated endonuclease/helicase Cas3